MSEKRNMVYGFTKGRIEKLGAEGQTMTGKANLALLRRGLGKQPFENPDLWGLVLDKLPKDLLPEDYQKRRGCLSPAEEAIYAALTLYALAQQGKDTKTQNMHAEGNSVGKAVGLAAGSDPEQQARMLSKLKKVLSVRDHTAMERSLRSLIQILKEKEIRLDYAMLAADLYSYHFPEGKTRVRNSWAHDYYFSGLNTQSENEAVETATE